ncbi:unnamed protein product [Pieris brassicae]|uniref:HTH CENPB-type domain-containing protein n=1 Tax=Pieris brassicae TaxID=7116 RepID=A0A9P0WZR0_PIEBR|nr:unnamed protein product [Pieris brassicae]
MRAILRARFCRDSTNIYIGGHKFFRHSRSLMGNRIRWTCAKKHKLKWLINEIVFAEVSTAPVRKHSTPSLDVKVEILKRLDKGEKQSALAKEYKLGRTTIYDIKRKRALIHDFATQVKHKSKTRKNLTSGRNTSLENALFNWYQQKKEHGVVLKNNAIRSKALYLNRAFNNNKTFRASSTWLAKFKDRFGISEV